MFLTHTGQTSVIANTGTVTLKFSNPHLSRVIGTCPDQNTVHARQRCFKIFYKPPYDCHHVSCLLKTILNQEVI